MAWRQCLTSGSAGPYVYRYTHLRLTHLLFVVTSEHTSSPHTARIARPECAPGSQKGGRPRASSLGWRASRLLGKQTWNGPFPKLRDPPRLQGLPNLWEVCSIHANQRLRSPNLVALGSHASRGCALLVPYMHHAWHILYPIYGSGGQQQ